MKMKSTKKALLMSALSLLLCCSMLIGTTFAWFTDTVVSGKNQIVAGNLDVELYYAKVNNGVITGWDTVAGKTNIFDPNALWEPGRVEVVYLKVSNLGSLALKYQLGVNVFRETSGTNVYDEEFELSDHLVFKVVEMPDGMTTYTDREAVKLAAGTEKGLKDYNGKTTKLDAKSDDPTVNDEDYVALIVYMPETVGNEANYKTGTAAPVIELGINLFATQVEAESDSFGPDYDNGAYFPVAPEKIPAEGGNLVLNGSSESGVTVDVPAAVVNNLPDTVTSLSVNASAPVVDTNNKTVKFSTVELVDQNGNEVDIAEAGGKVTVTLPVNGAFADGEKVEVYHDGSFVTYATVAGGKISYETSHFCKVEVMDAEEVVLDLTIDSVKEFMAFAADVNAGNTYAGKTVVLGADLDLAGVTWTPIGNSSNIFKGTFDGNGKVIKNLSVLMPGKSDVGLFGVTHDGEIKNVIVENAKIAGRLNVGVVAGTPYTSKYTNITVKGHVEVDGMAYVGAVGGKNAYANWTDITVNVDGASYVNANSVENGAAYRTYVGGVVGFNGEGGHTFKNITTNINVVGSTCDIGGAFGIAHYGNKFENVTVTGTVTGAEDSFEIGGIAGVWHNGGANVEFTNCEYNGNLALIGSAYNTTGNGLLKVDGVVYVGSVGALEAQLENNAEVINLAGNIDVIKSITVPAGKNVALNLNGYTISGTLSGTGNQDLFLVKGNLTMNNGSVQLTATQNQGWNAMSTIFDITAGGVVTLDNVVAENKGGTDMNFVAHLNNWGSASLSVNNSILKATYIPVRVFNSGYDMNNVTIKSSKLEGKYCFWVHNYTAEGKDDSTLNVSIYGNDNTFEFRNDYSAAVLYGFSNSRYFDATGKEIVFASKLADVMAAAKNGNVIIDAQGANLGDFNYDGTFGNGTVLRNAKFTYVYGASVDGVATFENCEFVSDHSYSANFSDGKYTGKVVFNNCYFDGWNSFGTAITSVEMNNCTFETVVGPYSLLRFYQDAVLNNCVIKDSFDGIDTNKTGTVIKLNNCDGIEGKIYNNTDSDSGVVQVGTWIVNGVELTDVPAW